MTRPICHKVQLLLSGRRGELGGEGSAGGGGGGRAGGGVNQVPDSSPNSELCRSQMEKSGRLRRKPGVATGSTKHVKVESRGALRTPIQQKWKNRRC